MVVVQRPRKDPKMPINPDAVGAQGGPVRRSWTSKDALLYAVGVGAGTDELPFTTENTKDLAQRVLPTFAVIIGGGGAPIDKVGSFNPALMVHGEQGIELFDEIPPAGEIESVGKVVGITRSRSTQWSRRLTHYRLTASPNSSFTSPVPTMTRLETR